MAYQSNDDRPRAKYQGNWSCSHCGGAITELPFEPDPSRLDTLKCYDCHSKDRPRRGFGRGGNNTPRQKYQGNWTCSSCGTSITELPFKPDPSREGELLCRDCHMQSKKAA